MPEPDDKETLIQVVTPLVTGLYESLDRALELAQQHFVEFDMIGREYRPVIHHLARAHGRRLLLSASAEGRLGGWKVAKPRPNLQVLLYHEQIELRLLRPLGQDVPPPGPNPARQAYYTNLHDNLLGIKGSRLLGLWSVGSAADEVSIRVVRTTGAWKHGKPERVDIDFIVPRGVDTLEGLEFIPTESLGLELPFEAEDRDGEGEGDGTEG